MKHLAWVLVPVTGKSYKQIREIINEIVTDVNLSNHIFEHAGKIDVSYTIDSIPRYGRKILWYTLVRILKPSVTIQSGLHNGLGTCILSAAIIKNRNEGFKGDLYAVDISPTTGGFIQPPYKGVVDLHVQDSLDYVRSFDKSIDLFINDSNHSNDREFEMYQIVSDKSSDKSIIISDNVHVTDVLPDFAAQTDRCFAYFQESPIHHFYPGDGSGIAYKPKD